MKSKDKTFAILKVKLPIETRIVSVDDIDLGFSGEGNIIRSEVLTSSEYTYSKKINDYAPYKYRYVQFQPLKDLKFEGSEEIIISFKNKLQDLLLVRISVKVTPLFRFKLTP